jgi:hypothetical protein
VQELLVELVGWSVVGVFDGFAMWKIGERRYARLTDTGAAPSS